MINGHLANWVTGITAVMTMKTEELPSLEALEEHLCTPAHNRTIPSALDGNQTDNSAEERRIGAVPQFRRELRTPVTASQESLGAEKSKAEV